MIDARVLDEIAESLGRLLPPGMANARDDFEKNARAGVQSVLGRLDLVTREEFDVQAKLLSRTREKLDALQHRVDALEARLDSPPE